MRPASPKMNNERHWVDNRPHIGFFDPVVLARRGGAGWVWGTLSTCGRLPIGPPRRGLKTRPYLSTGFNSNEYAGSEALRLGNRESIVTDRRSRRIVHPVATGSDLRIYVLRAKGPSY